MTAPRLGVALPLAAVVACAVAFGATAACGGLSSTAQWGIEVTETLAPGASEGEVIMKHGPADEVVPLGTQYWNPQTGELGQVDKHLYNYRLGGSASVLGRFSTSDESHNICYLVEGGRVFGGGYVGHGRGQGFLGASVWTQILLGLCGVGILAAAVVAPGARAARAVAAALATAAAALFGVIVPVSLAVTLTLALLLWREALAAAPAAKP